MKYKFLEHTADVKLQAFGKTLNGCFENAGEAMFSVMYDLKKVKQNKSIKFSCSAENSEELLIEFLNKLLAESTINEIVFSGFKVKIKNNILTAEAFGEKLDFSKHDLKLEVKAATYSELFVKKEKGKFVCQVVIDV